MADVLGQERNQLVITLKDAHGETFNFNISNQSIPFMTVRY